MVVKYVILVSAFKYQGEEELSAQILNSANLWVSRAWYTGVVELMRLHEGLAIYYDIESIIICVRTKPGKNCDDQYLNYDNVTVRFRMSKRGTHLKRPMLPRVFSSGVILC
jgi:hypothetical protein